MANKYSPQVAPKPIPSWACSLAIFVAVVFLISSLFPVIAALTENTASFPPIWGVLDVIIAFTLAILAFAIVAVTYGKVDSLAEKATYRAYRLLIHAIFLLILLFFIFGDRIVWANGLPGIGWRAWVLFYCLPYWFAALHRQRSNITSGAA